MGFPESILTTDERVVLHLHPHWKKLVGPVFTLILAVAAVAAAALLQNTVLLLGAALIAVLLVARFTVWPLLVWRTTHYVFTNERILMREGVFARKGRDIPLARVNDVSFAHSLPDRVLGCGTMTIESAGERGQLVLVDLPNVERTQSVLYELVEADRDRHTFGDEDRAALTHERREGRRDR